MPPTDSTSTLWIRKRKGLVLLSGPRRNPVDYAVYQDLLFARTVNPDITTPPIILPSAR